MGKWVHRLQDINEEDRTGYCLECGTIVELRWKGLSSTGRAQWMCENKNREYEGTPERKAFNAKKQRERNKNIKRDLFNDNYWLYKAFSLNEDLLYVGITNNPRKRFEAHRRDSVWWSAHSRMDLIEIGTKEQAIKTEREIIQQERPLFNIQDN